MRDTMRWILGGLLVWVATAAGAGVGVTTLAARGERGPVTVFYATAAAERELALGRFLLHLAPAAEPLPGRRRLVVISPGTAGSANENSDLAKALVNAGYAVAVPEHRGDHTGDFSDAGPASWRRRPAEVSAAIDALADDSRFAPLLALDRVGVYGMSAGGHTALSMAGGRWSTARLRTHCEAHLAEDFPSCVGPTLRLDGSWGDRLKLSLARLALRLLLRDEGEHVHADRRVAAVVAAVPYAADFDPASLAAPAIPLGLVTARRDAWLAPAFHGDAVRRACPRCELVFDFAHGGHGAPLSPPLPPLPGRLGELLAEPPGFDRAEVARMNAAVVRFFQRYLPPPR